MLDAKSEMEALWAAVFSQPPAIDADPSLLARLILHCSPPPPVYDLGATTRLRHCPDSMIVDECLPSRTTPASGSPEG
ncbi:MAG TPA: hypothetical protein VN694_01640 [Caulobacteraceae bacterium]|nr:hypothetical protein [Caulobacteraceae bacterium]